MAPDDTPTFLELRARRSGPRRARVHAASPLPQLSLDLAPALELPALEVPAVKPAPPPEPVIREPILYTVRQLIAELRQHVESAYTAILNVEGEISNCRPAASGHIYFTLKDGDAQLPVVLFRRNAQLLSFKPKDGLAVEVRGRVTVYETRGQLQLVAESLRPRGTGALQLAFEQLRDRLRREGLFDRERKPLPPFPHCIGIVTAPSGAAIRDIVNVVRRRHARLNLLIYPAVMQGTQCPSTVAAGIRFFNRIAKQPLADTQIPCVDLIVIARGGGSIEDLAGFNDERLARAIVASALPVVSAIGHEIDHTIADYVADLRAPTPSAAAELVTSAQHRIEERVLSLERRVHRASEFHLLRARQRFQRLSAEQVLFRLRDSIGRREQRIDELRFRMAAASTARRRTIATRLAALEARLRRHDPAVRLTLASRRLATVNAGLQRVARQLISTPVARLQSSAVRLNALSPLAVLSRGYAIVYSEDGRILTSPSGAGSEITARLANGMLRARVMDEK